MSRRSHTRAIRKARRRKRLHYLRTQRKRATNA